MAKIERLHTVGEQRKPCRIAVIVKKTLGDSLDQEVFEFVGTTQIEPKKRKALGLRGIIDNN